MKRFIYLLLPLLLLSTASCGVDEPEEPKPISCLAHYTDVNGDDCAILANFYLFEGTNFVGIDPDSRTGILDATKIDAVTSSGTHVQNIGWCHSNNRAYSSIVPVYTQNNSFERIGSGDFTIVCIPAQKGNAHAYMMKSFSKKRDELVKIDANFKRSDFNGEWGEWKKIPWR